MTLEFGKQVPVGDWKEGWKSKLGEDRVHFNGDEALVGIDFIERCPFHSKDVFCRSCLPRLMDVLAAAQQVIDPEVPAVAEKISGDKTFPEYIALVNPVAKNAFAVRLQDPVKLVARKPIYTTKDPTRGIPGPITVVKYVNKNQVCDCPHLRGFYVRLEGASEEYARRFWDAKLTFQVDGDRLADRIPIHDLLSKKEILFKDEMKDGCLFLACAISKDTAEGRPGPVVDRSDFLGYMTPNGSTFLVTLEDIPGGGGLVHLEVGWNLPEYTTRGFEPGRKGMAIS